jgi:hypothetical protein
LSPNIYPYTPPHYTKPPVSPPSHKVSPQPSRTFPHAPPSPPVTPQPGGTCLCLPANWRVLTNPSMRSRGRLSVPRAPRVLPPRDDIAAPAGGATPNACPPRCPPLNPPRPSAPPASRQLPRPRQLATSPRWPRPGPHLGRDTPPEAFWPGARGLGPCRRTGAGRGSRGLSKVSPGQATPTWPDP